MTNHTNPLMDASKPKRGKVTVEMLHDLAESLNRSYFVIDSGRPYFVGQRDKPSSPGVIEHFLDRH